VALPEGAGRDGGALGPEFRGVLTTIGLRIVPCGGVIAVSADAACACASLTLASMSTYPPTTLIAAADAPPASLPNTRLYM
jgi:hypothetical protein